MIETASNVVQLSLPSELAAGLHLGRLERRLPEREGAYRVALCDGTHVEAELAPEVELAFGDECLRDNRSVMLMVSQRGVYIAGALQTSRTVSRDHRDNLHLEGKHVRIDAENGLVMHVGKSSLRLDKNGAIKLSGQKMSVDVATVVKILSALVELP